MKTTIKTTSIIKGGNYQHNPTKRATKTSPTPDPSVHLTKSNKQNRNIVSAAKKKALVNKTKSHKKMIYFDYVLRDLYINETHIKNAMHINKLFIVRINSNFGDFELVEVVELETGMCTAFRIGFVGGMRFLGCLPNRKGHKLEDQRELDTESGFHTYQSASHECQQACQIHPQEPYEDLQKVPLKRV